MSQVVACIGKIIEINPIPKADFIVSATVVCGKAGKWMGTVKKDQFNVGDLVEVYLQDASLPKTDEFKFMESYHYRVSMRRFKKVPSECLIMPLTVKGFGIGDNIADIKGVLKYEKPISANLSGIAYGSFPTYILPKTDEPNFQTVPEMVEYLQGIKYYSTVKADGSSGTIYKTEDHFGCCSRNLELKEDDKSVVWLLSKKYNLEKLLPKGFAIQFEMVGPGIQKNKLKLESLDMQVFNVYNITERRYLGANVMVQFCNAFNLPTVEIIDWDQTFNFKNDEELRKYAEGEYQNGGQREGVVFRPMVETSVGGERLSFKVINLLYKD